MLNRSPHSQSTWIWLGRQEAQSLNNHGTWYDVQVANLALATEQTELVRCVLSSAPERRLTRQLHLDGGQPFKLIRSKSWDYSVMNLEAMFRLARLGEAVDVDLWNWRDQQGRSLRGALDFLSASASGTRP